MTSEPMTPERLAEARAYLAAQERELAELKRLHGCNDPEVEHRLPVGDVDLFLRRERDEYEPRGECWNTVSDVLDSFRLHVITGTPLTAPRPEGGPEAFGVGKEPLTEAEELRAERDRLRHALERAALSVEHDRASRTCQERITPIHNEDCPACEVQAALSSSPTEEKG